MPRQVPRVRATPRQIRDIKPKRQLPRSEQSDHNEEWWQEEAEANAAAPSNSREANAIINPLANGNDNNNSDQGPIRSFQTSCSYWYNHTSRIKKLKQLFWTFILYRALKLIYAFDLDNYYSSSTKSWSSTTSMYDPQSYLKDRSIDNKSFFSNEDLAEASMYSQPKSSSYGMNGSSSSSGSLRGSEVKITEPDYILGPYSSNSKSIPKTAGVGSSGGVKLGPLGGMKKVVHSIFGSSDKTKTQQLLSSSPQQSFGRTSLESSNSFGGSSLQAQGQQGLDQYEGYAKLSSMRGI